jgi:ABC-type uncharacterized transport system permease subunit
MRPRMLDAVLTAVVAGLLTVAVLAVAGAPPWGAIERLVAGALGSPAKVAQVLAAWAPLVLCASGLVYSFRAGLWNIGVEGQVVFGAVGAAWALRQGLGSQFPSAFVALSLIAGGGFGALWGLLAGLLKTRGGVNEIFAGLGLNFVAQGITLWLIFGPWKRLGIASMSGTEPFPTELWLSAVSWGRVSSVALGCAAGALAVTAVLISRTRLGLCLKAVGRNPAAATLFGLDPSRYALAAMGLAGALAGLAGAIQVAAVYHRLIPAISSNYGYLSLLVVMLSGYRCAPIAPVAFFFAVLNVGSIQLPMTLRLDSSLSGVVQGALVLSALFVYGWRAARTAAK